MLSFSSLQPTTTSAAATTRAALPHQLSLSCSPLPHLNIPHRRRRRRAIASDHPHDSSAHLITHAAAAAAQSPPPTPTKLKIAILGFGNFGQFLVKAFIHQGHTVYAHSRSTHHHLPTSQTLGGATFFSDLHDLCEHHPDVILISTSIISTVALLKSLPLQRLRRNTLFVDVLSVKEFPKNTFLHILPHHFDILCTHPMFGPQSGKHTWHNLPFVFDKVRIGNEASRVNRVETFLDIFKNEGCTMVEMSCAEHDKYAAGSQFITHTMGRILEKLQLESTPINTKGYETLLNLVENTSSDSFDLYYGLFMYNKNAMEQLERLDLAFEALKKELFGHLHEVLRKQLVGKSEESGGGALRRPMLAKLPKNGTPLLPLPQSESVSNNKRLG